MPGGDKTTNSMYRACIEDFPDKSNYMSISEMQRGTMLVKTDKSDLSKLKYGRSWGSRFSSLRGNADSNGKDPCMPLIH